VGREETKALVKAEKKWVTQKARWPAGSESPQGKKQTTTKKGCYFEKDGRSKMDAGNVHKNTVTKQNKT